MSEPHRAAAVPTGRPRRPHRPTPVGPHRPRVRRPLRLTLLAATVALAAVAAGCSGGDPDAPDTPDPAAAATATGGVSGPLCASLPTGTDPGNPESLAGEPVDVAVRWIPVLTTFDAAVRATGLAAELRGAQGVTVLAPTDDAFARKFSASNLDELLIHDRDTLRQLLRAHLVNGSYSLAELVAAGSVTTMDGTRLTVAPAESTARIGDVAQAVCADYRVAGGRIHLIDAVLGNLPTTAGRDDDPAH